MRLFSSLLFTAMGIGGTLYTQYKAKQAWNGLFGPGEKAAPPEPLHGDLKRDPYIGEFIPESLAYRRRVNGKDYYFADLNSYIKFRNQEKLKDAVE